MEGPGIVLRAQPIRDHPDAAVVTIEGSIDPKTVTRFKDKLQALATGGTRRFFLDCGRLTYINSSGLAYLLNLSGIVKPKGGMIALAAVDPKILVIFNMMGITQLFQFYPSFADALRELDEKLALELQDVGPALPLEDQPKPVAATSAKTAPPGRPSPRMERPPRVQRPLGSAASGNPILRFFRRLFGFEEIRPASAPRRRVRR